MIAYQECRNRVNGNKYLEDEKRTSYCFLTIKGNQMDTPGQLPIEIGRQF